MQRHPHLHGLAGILTAAIALSTVSRSAAAAEPSAEADSVEVPGPATATVFEPAGFAKKLQGKHKLYMQWIEKSGPGRMVFTPQRGVRWKVQGEHKTRDGQNYVRISGEVVRASLTEIVIEGTLVTRVSYIARGRICTRRDDRRSEVIEMTFSKYGGRPYFRLVEMDNPCAKGVVDYIDLHL